MLNQTFKLIETKLVSSNLFSCFLKLRVWFLKQKSLLKQSMCFDSSNFNVCLSKLLCLRTQTFMSVDANFYVCGNDFVSARKSLRPQKNCRPRNFFKIRHEGGPYILRVWYQFKEEALSSLKLQSDCQSMLRQESYSHYSFEFLDPGNDIRLCSFTFHWAASVFIVHVSITTKTLVVVE